MTRQQFTILLILSLLAVCACGVTVPTTGNPVATEAPEITPRYPAVRFAVQAAQVERLQVERRDGWKAGP